LRRLLPRQSSLAHGRYPGTWAPPRTLGTRLATLLHLRPRLPPDPEDRCSAGSSSRCIQTMTNRHGLTSLLLRLTPALRMTMIGWMTMNSAWMTVPQVKGALGGTGKKGVRCWMVAAWQQMMMSGQPLSHNSRHISGVAAVVRSIERRWAAERLHLGIIRNRLARGLRRMQNTSRGAATVIGGPKVGAGSPTATAIQGDQCDDLGVTRTARMHGTGPNLGGLRSDGTSETLLEASL